MLAWLPSLDGSFTADDFVLLRTADAVQSPVWPLDRNDLGESGGAGHFYRPLWVAWNAALLGAFGDHPGPFHAANLILFGLLAVEVFLLARALLPPPGALAAAVAFAVYPRHGESVAWVSGSTDLLAAALALAALLALLAPWRERTRIAAAVALTLLAAVAKEAAFLLPALALLLRFALPERRTAGEVRPPGGPPAAPAGRAALPLTAPVAMAAALAGLFVVRTIVLGGLGGYGDEHVTVRRLAATAASYGTAAASPSQLLVLRHPLLLAVPVAVAAALAWALLRPRGRPERARVALAGIAWFAIALVPVLGLPLDLNNANGERLLLLPSVGLVLALGAAVPRSVTRRGGALLAAAAVLGGLLCLDVARTWVTAGALADRTVREAAALAPPSGRLTLLSIPDSYRSARVFTNSFDLALARAGRAGTAVDWCVPVLVLHEHRGEIRFRRTGSAAFYGTTTADAPFDFPVLRDPAPLTPGCSYGRARPDRGSPGLRLGAVARRRPGGPAPSGIAAFDGHDVRPAG